MNPSCELIVGPMFSGKTTAIIQRWKINNLKNIPTIVINYEGDNRYDSKLLSSHDKVKIPCVKLSKLEKLFELFKNDETFMTDGIIKQEILINEGQFFDDLYVSVKKLLGMGHSVVVGGLDGDYKMEKFGEILDLIPLSTKITKLKAVCYNCYGDAYFTMRVSNSKEQKIIGGDDIYRAVCRKCHCIYDSESKQLEK